MKNLLLLSLVFFSTTAYASTVDTLPIILKRLDTVTVKGKPSGKPNSMEIDKGGGRLVSDDGRLELIFPQGALTKKKKITIQPVSNHAANGRGLAYHLTPSGTAFEKDVTLVFHYAEDELQGSMPELKGIAWQDEKGKWSALKHLTADTVNRTITSVIRHFSSYASFDKIVLQPANARVKVEKTISMSIQYVVDRNEESQNENEDFLPPLPSRIPAPEWSVNDVVMGNADVGQIRRVDQNNNLVNYTAPVSVPEQNPVAVSAELKGMEFRFNNKVFKDPSLVSNVLIYDRAYRVHIEFWTDNSEDGMCTMRLEDEGAFTVVMEGSRTQIKEISNHNLRLTFNPCKCGFIWTNSPLPGPINISGAGRIDVKPAKMPELPFARVSILLKHIKSPMPDLKTTCPTGGLPPGMGLARPYLPPLIEFEANNEDERLLTLAELTGNSMSNSRRHGLKIHIKLIDE